MTSGVCVVDTNVIVSGLIGADPNSPPSRILDAMLDGGIIYLMSDELLDEYSCVLRRPGLVRLHGLTGEELDRLLADLVANAMWRVSAAGVTLRTPEISTCGHCSPAIPRGASLRATGFFLKTRQAASPSFPHAPLPIVSCPRNSVWTYASWSDGLRRRLP